MIFFEMHSCFLENVTEYNVIFVEKIWLVIKFLRSLPRHCVTKRNSFGSAVAAGAAQVL